MQFLRLSSGSRFWEIDFWRGLAVSAMIVFHFLFDLNFFASYSFNLFSGAWFLLGRFAAVSMLFLVGVSLTLSFNRKTQNFLFYFKRGIQIFGFGLLITLVTFLFFSQGTIWFGVLHSIGVSIILGCFFVKRKKLALFLGIILIVFGLYLSRFSFDFPWLLWLGFFPKNLYTFDYFPLLPWFGVVLLGVFAGNKFYVNGNRSFQIKELSNNLFVKIVSFLGRNSLIIYLIHQPILIIVLRVLILA